MERHAIVIITEEFDIHADRLVQLLTQRGERVVRFHTADYPLKNRLSFTHGPGSSAASQGHSGLELEGTVRVGEREVALQEIKSVWVRRPTAYRFAPQLSGDDLAFARRETHHALWGLWGMLGEQCLWVNHPYRTLQARYKLWQLHEAARLGFATPLTLLTTDPQEALGFYERCQGQMIHKALHPASAVSEEGELLLCFTNRINPDQVDISRIRFSPCLFQEYVEKEVELRVTVVGEQVFACEIHSQQSHNPKTRVDWRHYSLEDTPHRAIELPPPLRQLCLGLVRRLGLEYGAIDLIRQKDGSHVFLEINSEGQFGWIEKLTGLPISEALADLLASGKASGQAGSTAFGVTDTVALPAATSASGGVPQAPMSSTPALV